MSQSMWTSTISTWGKIVNKQIWIGFDPRETAAFAVARTSIRKRLRQPIPVKGLVLDDLKLAGLYWRPTEYRKTAEGRRQIWDVISEAPCATEFSISRFLVPILAKAGWAVFLDCDMLALASLQELFDLADPLYAVMCVKHKHVPTAGIKMDGQAQTIYSRKNWSSMMLWNCDHPANRKLTVELINTVPGRDLHRFCWLKDDEIGDLGPEWNWLAGTSDPKVTPKIVHHTEGSPCMPGYEDTAFAPEWREELSAWAR